MAGGSGGLSELHPELAEGQMKGCAPNAGSLCVGGWERTMCLLGRVSQDERAAAGAFVTAMSKKDTRDAEPAFEKLSFEQALALLEETVQELETGGLALDKATGLFERGLKLARLCSERLATAELRISQIQTAYGEQMRFLPDDEPEPEDEA